MIVNPSVIGSVIKQVFRKTPGIEFWSEPSANIPDQVDIVQRDLIELLTDLTREKLVLQA